MQRASRVIDNYRLFGSSEKETKQKLLTIRTKFIREKWVVETTRVASIKPEGRVPVAASKENSSANGFACYRREEGKIRSTGCVHKGNGGDVDAERKRAARDGGGIIIKNRGVEEGGSIDQGVWACVKPLIRIRVGDECIRRARRIRQHIHARYSHKRTKFLQRARRYDLRVFPTASPGYADLRGSGGDVIEELAGVVVFSEVCKARGAVCYGEMGSVE